MNFFPGDGFLVEPNSVVKFSVISFCPQVTCKSRQVIESLGEAGVGNALTSVAVGCGSGVIVAGALTFDEAQAVKMSNPSSGRANIVFIGNI